MKQLALLIFVITLSAAPALGSDPAAKNCTVVIGVPMDAMVVDMEEFYHERFVSYKSLVDRLPCRSEMLFFPDCSSAIKALESGKADAIGGRADCYLRAREAMGVVPLFSGGVKSKSTHRMVLLVRKDSRFRTIEELKGGRFSSVRTSDSLEYSLFPEYQIRKTTGEGLRKFFGRVIPCPTIMAAIQSVILGQSDATVADEEFYNINSLREKLRPLAYSFEVPYPILFTRRNAPYYVLETARVLKEELKRIPDDMKIGKKFNVISGIHEPEDPDFKQFRIELEKMGLLERTLKGPRPPAPK